MKFSTMLALAAVAVSPFVLNAESALQNATATLIQESVVLPEYPEQARTRGITGIVRVECLINDKGEVIVAEIVQSVHPFLDKATVDAVKQWKFTPAVAEGKAVYTAVIVPVQYNLKGTFILQDKEVPVL